MQLIEFIINISSDFIASTLIIILCWFRDDFVNKMLIAYHFLIGKLSRKKYVLIWNDDKIENSENISKKLDEKLKLEKNSSIIFQSLNTPKEILDFPMNSSIVQAIILIVSDVTKLSENSKTKDKIQNWLVDYLGKGGGIIGTHDLIYRRVRNDKLEDAFGCQLNYFERVDGKGEVKYLKNPCFENHDISKELPDSFELDDGEIICGKKWHVNANCLFHTDEENPKPLVVAIEKSKGKAVWINSADKKDGLAESISKPADEFIDILKSSIKWVNKKN